MTDRSKSTASLTEWLKSLNWHMSKHDIVDTVSSITMPHYDKPGEVQLYPWRASDLTLLAEWVRTLRGVTITVTAMPEDRESTAHLSALGAMGDGTSIRVVVVVDGAEFDLLAVNTPLLRGADIAVDLLLSLVDAKSAESRVPVTAGTAAAS